VQYSASTAVKDLASTRLAVQYHQIWQGADRSSWCHSRTNQEGNFWTDAVPHCMHLHGNDNISQFHVSVLLNCSGREILNNLKTGITVSNPGRGIGVCPRFLCLVVLYGAGRGLLMADIRLSSLPHF